MLKRVTLPTLTRKDTFTCHLASWGTFSIFIQTVSWIFQWTKSKVCSTRVIWRKVLILWKFCLKRSTKFFCQCWFGFFFSVLIIKIILCFFDYSQPSKSSQGRKLFGGYFLSFRTLKYTSWHLTDMQSILNDWRGSIFKAFYFAGCFLCGNISLPI